MQNTEHQNTNPKTSLRGSEIFFALGYYLISGVLLCVALYGLLSLLWDSSAVITHASHLGRLQ